MKKKVRKALERVASQLPDTRYEAYRYFFAPAKKGVKSDRVLQREKYTRPVNHLKRLKRAYLASGWAGVERYIKWTNFFIERERDKKKSKSLIGRAKKLFAA